MVTDTKNGTANTIPEEGLSWEDFFLYLISSDPKSA